MAARNRADAVRRDEPPQSYPGRGNCIRQGKIGHIAADPDMIRSLRRHISFRRGDHFRPTRVLALSMPGQKTQHPFLAERGTLELKHAALISHTASGYNRRHGIDHVAALAEQARLPHFVVRNSADLPAALRRCGASEIRLLIVNAGDGTVCEVLRLLREEQLFPAQPVLALIKGGTTNMIHKGAGLAGNPGPALHKLINSLAQGRIVIHELSPLRICRESRPVRYGFFFATNAAVRAILYARRHHHSNGRIGWTSELMSSLKMILRLARRRVERDPILSPVELEWRQGTDSWRRSSHVLLMATSLRQFILGLKPLRPPQKAGWTILEWPDYRLRRWLGDLFSARLNELKELSLRGTFDWILDGEVHAQRRQDPPLTIDIAAPVRFLVDDER